MKKFTWQAHIVLVLLSSLVLLSTIQSRWVVGLLGIPSIVSKVAAVLTYIPFLLFAVWKLVCDIKRPPKDIFSILFYLFALYYAAISVYRFLTNAEVKENLYLSAVLFGSLAFFSLLHNRFFSVSAQNILDDLSIFCGILLAYRAIHLIALEKWLWYSPINEITLGAIHLLLLPIIFFQLCKHINSKKAAIWHAVLLFGSVLSILTLSSRAVFLVMVFSLIVLFFIFIKNKKVIQVSLVAVLCSVVVIVGLFIADAGGIRYSVYRETGLATLSQYINTPPSPDDTTRPNQNLLQNTADQINRSDSMRENLIKYSLEEIKKNPLFGTGDVLFTHAYDGLNQTIEAPAHNIILQTMNCYGVIGLLLIAAIVIAMVLQTKLLHLRKEVLQQQLCSIFVLIIFFGISLIQATAYDILVMPTIFTCISGFSCLISGQTSWETDKQ